jgi:hypothetical protein
VYFGGNDVRDVVTSADVVQRFATTRRASGCFAAWKSDPRRFQVVPAVMEHVSQVVMSASLDEVEQVCVSTSHALGDIQKATIDPVTHVRDWTTSFAFTHVFHFISERDGAIPTWQRLCAAWQQPPFADMLYIPTRRAIEEIAASSSFDEDVVKQAMHWRLGNSYYSFLREQWVHAYLRSRGIPVLQHPLSDALYRVDGWCDDTIVSLFIGNETYRTKYSGRKVRPSYLLAGAQSAWRFIDIELPALHKFGVVHLPQRASLDQQLRKFR